MITIILKLKPVLLDKLWGGNKLNKMYGYNSSNNCGEAWGISAYKGNSSIVINGDFKGMTFRDLFNNNKELFGDYKSNEFPILVKVIDANKDLSIQAHPDNVYAEKNHDSLGKTECWYILDAEKNTEIIIGHNAYDKQTIINSINSSNYDFLNRIPIKQNDQFKIPAGTIHAICAGTVLLEVQQSSDLTYRFYDYDRLENGEPRELHQQEALDVIKIPDNRVNTDGRTEFFDFVVIKDLKNEVIKANIFGDYYFIIDGEGTFDDVKIKKGDFIFVSSNHTYMINGKLDVGFINLK